jgi:hypothetical protein
MLEIKPGLGLQAALEVESRHPGHERPPHVPSMMKIKGKRSSGSSFCLPGHCAPFLLITAAWFFFGETPIPHSHSWFTGG